MVLLEALSFGIPVVTTSRGGLAELVTDGVVGFQVRPADAREIARKIDLLVGDPAMYEDFSTSALRYSRRFDSAQFEKRLRTIFLSL